MPVYCYKCTDCELEFEVRHSMSFEDQLCVGCESEKVFKIPSLSSSQIISGTRASKPGKVVDNYIRDVKQEIKQEKKELRSREL